MLRTLSVIVGVGLLLFTFSWPDVLPSLSEALEGRSASFLTSISFMLGVYLMFLGLTGEWLPGVDKRKGRR